MYTNIVSAENLILPELTLTYNAYSYMFQGCTKLIIPPKLPATTLEEHCYYHMFDGCTSLIVAPELPATTLVSNCYDSMFAGCTSLTVAPTLPATALTNSCYANMFNGCTNLATAPELPATTLEGYCYNGMFQGCVSINYIKAMFTTTPSTSYTKNWVSGVASSGTFVKNATVTLQVLMVFQQVGLLRQQQRRSIYTQHIQGDNLNWGCPFSLCAMLIFFF